MNTKPSTFVCQGVFISGLAEARPMIRQLSILITRVMGSVLTVTPNKKENIR
jgi:hypothetical protein